MSRSFKLKSWNPTKPPKRMASLLVFTKYFGKTSFLISAFNYAYGSGMLSITQRRGIFKLIPKKDSEPYFLKNWSPLTLLNCDYKIAAKVITNRIKTVIPRLINNDQTSFLKGRFIGENIRMIDCISKYALEKNIPGLLLFIDFEKDFDSLEGPFIERTLQCFGYGPSLIHWFKTFNKNIERCVLNNGWSSSFFNYRGVLGKDALSPVSLHTLGGDLSQSNTIQR